MEKNDVIRIISFDVGQVKFGISVLDLDRRKFCGAFQAEVREDSIKEIRDAAICPFIIRELKCISINAAKGVTFEERIKTETKKLRQELTDLRDKYITEAAGRYDIYLLIELQPANINRYTPTIAAQAVYEFVDSIEIRSISSMARNHFTRRFLQSLDLPIVGGDKPKRHHNKKNSITLFDFLIEQYPAKFSIPSIAAGRADVADSYLQAYMFILKYIIAEE